MNMRGMSCIALAVLAMVCPMAAFGAESGGTERPRIGTTEQLTVGLPNALNMAEGQIQKSLSHHVREGSARDLQVEAVRPLPPRQGEARQVQAPSGESLTGPKSADDILERLRTGILHRPSGAGQKTLSSAPMGETALLNALHAAGADHLAPAVTKHLRDSGRARLMADRQAFRPQPGKKTASIQSTLEAAMPRLARRTALGPLPEVAPSMPPPSKHDLAQVRLLDAIANTDSPDEADRLGLPLAASYVGSGDWDKAREVYRDLSENARRAGIRAAALSNLRRLGDGGVPEGSTATESNTGRAE